MKRLITTILSLTAAYVVIMNVLGYVFGEPEPPPRPGYEPIEPIGQPKLPLFGFNRSAA